MRWFTEPYIIIVPLNYNKKLAFNAFVVSPREMDSRKKIVRNRVQWEGRKRNGRVEEKIQGGEREKGGEKERRGMMESVEDDTVSGRRRKKVMME